MLELVAQTGTALMIVTHSTNIAARMNRHLKHLNILKISIKCYLGTQFLKS